MILAHSIPEDFIHPQGYWRTAPRAGQSFVTPEGTSTNRRVELSASYLDALSPLAEPSPSKRGCCLDGRGGRMSKRVPPSERKCGAILFASYEVRNLEDKNEATNDLTRR
jgi:hypothetical protein